MSLTSYMTLGRSGLRVSPFTLGTITFGEDLGWAPARQSPRRSCPPFWTPEAYHRLRRIKPAVEPDDLIRSNHPIPPHQDAEEGHRQQTRPRNPSAPAATAGHDHQHADV